MKVAQGAGATRHWLSDHAMLLRRGARRLVVGVTAVGKAPRRFDYFKALDVPGHDLLLLNSPGNGWYRQGVPLGGGPPSLAATRGYLKALAEGYDEVAVLGGSMGAYGALLLGSAIPGARILAMAPEVYGGLAGGAWVQFCTDPELPMSLSALLADPGIEYMVVTGERNAADLFCTAEVPRGRLITLRNGYHQVATVIAAELGGIHRVVAPLLEGRLRQVLAPLAGQMAQFPDLGAVMYLLEQRRLSPERAEAFLASLPPGFYGRAFLLLRVAQLQREAGNAFRALELATAARALNPSDIETHLMHDRLWSDVHGAPPVPRFRDWLDPRFDGVVLYADQVAMLERLHGGKAVQAVG